MLLRPRQVEGAFLAPARRTRQMADRDRGLVPERVQVRPHPRLGRLAGDQEAVGVTRTPRRVPERCTPHHALDRGVERLLGELEVLAATAVQLGDDDEPERRRRVAVARATVVEVEAVGVRPLVQVLDGSAARRARDLEAAERDRSWSARTVASPRSIPSGSVSISVRRRPRRASPSWSPAASRATRSSPLARGDAFGGSSARPLLRSGTRGWRRDPWARRPRRACRA